MALPHIFHMVPHSPPNSIGNFLPGRPFFLPSQTSFPPLSSVSSCSSICGGRGGIRGRRRMSTHAVIGSRDKSDCTSVVAPSESAVRDFWRWLSEKGGVASSSSSVKPAFVTEGLGLLAEKDIAKNEVVLEIPKRLWIDADTVAASEIGSVCGGLKPWVSVSLFLAREKALGASSPWHPYLDILPPATDSTIFWSEEELNEIQGTQLLSTTLGVKELVQSEFTKVENEIILPNQHLFPSTVKWSEFLWAFGVLRSRAFTRLRGENLALVPLADLINHSSKITSEDSSWEVKGKGLFSREIIFSLKAADFVKRGEQVYIQYDIAKSNAELALDYGFIESRSERNVYTLTLEISESDPFYGDKLDIAESNGFGETAYFDIILGSPLPPVMLPYLRLVALGGTDAFLLESIFRRSIWGHLELPVSRDNEETICRVIRDACKSALSGYHTTIEEDELLAEDNNLDARLKIAIGIRAGEKKVLQQIDDTFRERESELDGLEYYQDRRLRELGLTGEQGDIIFWETK